jgi:hypothetical protein
LESAVSSAFWKTVMPALFPQGRDLAMGKGFHSV